MKSLGAQIVSFCSIILIVIMLHSCSIESYSTRKFAADNDILSYLNTNGYDVAPDSLGLVCIPLKQGNNVILVSTSISLPLFLLIL